MEWQLRNVRTRSGSAVGTRLRSATGEATARGRQTPLSRAHALHVPARRSPVRLQRQEKGKPAKDDPARREAERIAKLEADFAAATAKPDWGQAALLLNAFDDPGIQTHLRNLSGTHQAAIRFAAPKAMHGIQIKYTKPGIFRRFTP